MRVAHSLDSKSTGSRCLGAGAGLLLLALGAGCQGSSDASGPVGGTVAGNLDVHCSATKIVQPTNQSSCHAAAPDMAGDGADMGDSGGSDYGDTLFNAEGDDDDCKYHLRFTPTPIRKSSKVTFTVTVTSLATNQPVTGADIRPEAFLSDTHPAPNSGSTTTEAPPGTYLVGPVVFDASGRWTLRYHLFESCTDAVDDSPHGHAAFFIDVP